MKAVLSRALKIMGMICFYGSGLAMFFFWWSALEDWLGFFGWIISIIFCPGIVIFPFIYWLVEGAFPLLYFQIWGVGILGIGIYLLACCLADE
jgi:hypothetical protein